MYDDGAYAENVNERECERCRDRSFREERAHSGEIPDGASAWSRARIVDETETGVENDDESAHTVRNEHVRARPLSGENASFDAKIVIVIESEKWNECECGHVDPYAVLWRACLIDCVNAHVSYCGRGQICVENIGLATYSCGRNDGARRSWSRTKATGASQKNASVVKTCYVCGAIESRAKKNGACAYRESEIETGLNQALRRKTCAQM
jgi:hypothetical protein